MICGSLADAARDTGARLLGKDRAFRGVSTDSRSLVAGQLYVALRGARLRASVGLVVPGTGSAVLSPP